MRPDNDEQKKPQGSEVIIPDQSSDVENQPATSNQLDTADGATPSAESIDHNQTETQTHIDSSKPIDNSTGTPAKPTVSAGADSGKRRLGKKKLLLISGLALLLVLATGSYVFGFYLPNKPENMWNAALDRTGEALDKTVHSATEQQKLDAFSKVQISGNIDLKSDTLAVNGTLNGAFDGKRSDASFDITVKPKDQAERKLSSKFLSDIKEGSQYPSLYLQLSGIRSLGADLETRIPGVFDYDGKWIAIEEAYIKSLAEQSQGGGWPLATDSSATKAKTEAPTAKDMADLTRALSGVTKEYILTADPSKAIFERRNYVGKETVDDTKMYRYKVGINKGNMKAFCKAANDRVFTTQVFKKTILSGVPEAARTQQKEAMLKDCDKDVDLKDELDLWVDTRYKLVHKLRITDKDNKQIHYEVGQTYKGGDDLSLFAAIHNGETKTDGKMSMHINLKSNETKADINFKSDGDSKADFSTNVTVKPLGKDVEVEKPADAIPIQSIIERYQINPLQLLYIAQYMTQVGGVSPLMMTPQPQSAITNDQMMIEEPAFTN